MNIIKKNQIIIYTFALMLVAAGYLNYTSNIKNDSIETSNEEVIEENINIINDDKKIEKEDDNENIMQESNKVADVGDATLVSSNDVITDYFVKSKLDRDSMYSQMIETYQKILNSNNSLETQKQSATQEITKINEIKNSIMVCENLIKTKGFENCVVFVNGESVSIVIGAESLKKEETAQIQNIISRELNVKVENIHISTK